MTNPQRPMTKWWTGCLPLRTMGSAWPWSGWMWPAMQIHMGFHADGWRNMWPWRDWVIKAFNNNMSYKDFVTWQLAGDLLPNATNEQILATAFHRNHPMTAEGGAVDEEFRLEYVADRTNTTSTALLGLTMECAKCHDHKFDPISQEEYYMMSAFFNNVKELGMTGGRW